jgi:UV DNA damage endonuclease
MNQTLGYACINTELRKFGITTNRGLRAATIKKNGIIAASELALQNAQDLYKTIEWNAKNNINLYRISSDILPWAGKIGIPNYPHYKQISLALASAGKLARDTGQRLTAHPGPFNLLASPKESVVLNTIEDLETHSKLFDLLGLSETPYNKINIHIGATYGDKNSAAKTWVKNFKRLSESCRKRLTVENDDKASMFSVRDLYDMVHSELNIPIVFDYHHHKFCTGDLSEENALRLAVSTWGDIKPVVHYSESKAIHENNQSIRPQAHSDFLSEFIDTYGLDIDIMLECKAKEQGLLQYREKYLDKNFVL